MFVVFVRERKTKQARQVQSQSSVKTGTVQSRMFARANRGQRAIVMFVFLVGLSIIIIIIIIITITITLILIITQL